MSEPSVSHTLWRVCAWCGLVLEEGSSDRVSHVLCARCATRRSLGLDPRATRTAKSVGNGNVSGESEVGERTRNRRTSETSPKSG